MNTIEAMHQAASELSVLADVALAKGHKDTSKTFFQKAFELERIAAVQTPLDETDTLSRFILLRSAAALAYKAQDYLEAEKLTALCLSENPPAFIKKELDEIAELVRKAQSPGKTNGHLQIRGILTQANADDSKITIKDDENQKIYSLFVPAKMMNRVVKAFWKVRVTVEAATSPAGVIVLKHINKTA
ncbi:MAG TPA: hypothetical protein ENJ95_03985 [Bacteroidetes bacterium]|nr:hypothetical protein [Bacteroidota bacterium]